ncbi:hypothetical protein IQ266_27080 [filamentous cyanobacterium LEGE 11480]|uniref:Uncharacterized protein n=1 Tax=Romeriopsis navalis LEGE 11480 TaxID=2777977 RepID=A0A928VRH3_9CYAN|nr:hypothetical protein [Romeriopsis navalis LEGE 11480]
MKGTEAARVLGEISGLVPEAKAIVHAASGLGRLVLPDGGALGQMRDLCVGTGGFLSVLVADAAVKRGMDVWGMRENVRDLMRAVKREFDGENVLSPGRFVG